MAQFLFFLVTDREVVWLDRQVSRTEKWLGQDRLFVCAVFQNMTTLADLSPPIAAANSRANLIIALGSNDVRVAERAVDLYAHSLFGRCVRPDARTVWRRLTSQGEYFARVPETQSDATARTFDFRASCWA